MQVRARISAYLTGEDATVRARRHALTVATNVIARAVGLAVILASLHIALPYLGSERYGIFAAVSGLAAALTFLDLGIGNGVITRIAQLRAAGAYDDVRRLSGSAIIILSLIGVAVLALGLPLTGMVSPKLFVRGLDAKLFPEAKLTLLTFVALFAISIPTNAVSRILFGLQEGYVTNAVTSVMSGASLIALLFAVKMGLGAPGLLALTFGAQPVTGLILFFIMLKRNLISFSSLDFRTPEIKNLLRVSRYYAILQIGGLSGSGADGMIISSTLGPMAVSEYSVCQRLFTLVSIPISIVNAPLWATYADADAKREYRFIRRTLIISLSLTAFCSGIGGLILFLFGPYISNLLTSESITIHRTLIANFGIWTTIDMLGMAFAMYMNGRGMVKPQVYVTLPFVAISLLAKFVFLPKMGVAWLPAITAVVYLAVIATPYLTIFRRRLFYIPRSAGE